jgi:site-specific recombinase XerD
MLAARGKSLSSLTANVRHIGRFLEFWVHRYPDRSSLAELAIQDLGAFVAKVRGANARPNHVHDRYYAVRRFAVRLQRIEDPLAPKRPADRLFDPTIAPKEPHHPLTGQKWIPESVIRQLDANIQHLGPVYMPVVSILRASGWRVSDVVSLCYDTCVQQEGDKWWLVGDIQKTRVLGHRIPITEDVALALRAQAEVVKASLTEAENPRHYLFPSVSSRRRGRPIASPNVLRALKQFAEKHAILGEDGKPFRLRTHASAIRRPSS